MSRISNAFMQSLIKTLSDNLDWTGIEIKNNDLSSQRNMSRSFTVETFEENCICTAGNHLKLSLDAVSGHGVTIEESQKAYEQWASTYEKDAVKYKFNSHLKVVSVLKETFPEHERGHLRTLDIGAGTGLVGKKLKKYGFLHIDALEPSSVMLEEARKENVYENYYVEFITGSPTSIPAGTNSYDVLTASAVYGLAHVPCKALYEMIRIVKPGGIVVIAANYDFLRECKNYTDLEPLMDRFEAAGKWKKVLRETWMADYDLNTTVERIAWCYRIR